MSDYVKSTNFASKDSLATGNPLKIVKGTEIDTEFNNIATAVATKADIASPTFTGTPAAPTATAGTNTTQIANTAFVSTAVTNERTATATLTNKTLTNPVVTGLTVNDSSISFEGSSDDAFETVLTVVNPTADRTVTIPDATTTLVGTDTTQTLTNKTINASQLVDNSVTTAKLATGEQMTAANVATATAGVSAGDIGTYVMARHDGTTNPVTFGSTVSGSDLKPSNATGNNVGSALTGTWRCMGYSVASSTSQNLVTLWLRTA